ncbi:hypothetical protein C8F01DRAFT_1248407 [Mycena amicta]|nr:hypothetical protein C8F01DRAFT_1248407 [Mycena amicta]
MDLDPPSLADPLEKIFQQVEQENEQRARQAEAEDKVAESLARVESSENLRKSRRRGSISITRFGQLSSSDDGTSAPTTPALSDIAAKSPFFQAQLRSQNHSQESFVSGGSTAEHQHEEDDHHVTHIHTIAPRQSISRAAGRLIPRRLSRARSAVMQSSANTAENVVISVAAATVELPENAELAATMVHAPLRNQPSKSSMGSASLVAKGGSWVTKAKNFTKKFRRKSRAPLVDAA